jgi:ubiquinone/menaquinone biosynthesis C-methylase UbiE
MNRDLANKIRFIMDECIPPIMRDSKWFMKLFFMLAFRKRNVDEIMDFKRRIWSMSQHEYDSFYSNLNSVSRNRSTDLNEQCLKQITLLAKDKSFESILDVGCGGGFLLKHLKNNSPLMELIGTDLFVQHNATEFTYIKAHAENLPFSDNSIDIVTCCHVLEHLKDPKISVSELIRVAKHKVVIVVPCQRPYYYTLDEHINFYIYPEQISELIGLKNYRCEKVDGDWIYIGDVK